MSSVSFIKFLCIVPIKGVLSAFPTWGQHAYSNLLYITFLLLHLKHKYKQCFASFRDRISTLVLQTLGIVPNCTHFTVN